MPLKYTPKKQDPSNQQKTPSLFLICIFVSVVVIIGLLLLYPSPPHEVKAGARNDFRSNSLIAAADQTQTDDTKATSPPLSADEKNEINSAIREHLKLLKDNEIEKSYQSYTSEQFKKITSLKEFEEFLNHYPELVQFDNVRFGDMMKDDKLHQITVIVEKGGEESSFDYGMVKENNTWKIWGIQVEKSISHPPINKEELDALSQVIKGQLDALNDLDFSKAYYAYVSQEFEKNTSFDEFKKFIETYPVFTHFDSFKILEGIVEGDLRLVQVRLENDGRNYMVDYRFMNEKDKWKIFGMQIHTDAESLQKEKEENENIRATIKEQLEAISSEDISKAYYAFTAHEFQDASTKEVFAQFIQSHPSLAKNDRFEITQIKVSDGVGTALVRVFSNNTEETFEYRLTYEGNRWKILSIKTQETADTATQAKSGFRFDKGEFGTTIDLQGKVTNPSTNFFPKDREITLNLNIKNGKKGDTISVVLKHMDSQSALKPVSTALEKDGDALASFIFTSPTQGWPQGNYQVEATSSTGAREIFSFDVH